MRDRLLEAMALRRMNGSELARRSGVAQSQISRLTTGSREEMKTSQVEKIAHALDVRFDWLATGRGSMTSREASDDDDLELDVFEERAHAVKHARALGYSERAIKEVKSIEFPTAAQQPRLWWFEQIRALSQQEPVDAGERSEGRATAKVPEPRAGVRKRVP